MEYRVNNDVYDSARGVEIDDAILTITEAEADKIEWPLNKRWFGVTVFLGMALMLLLMGRAFQLTVVRGAEYQEMARKNTLRAVVINAPRGRIYDKNGLLLAENVPSTDLVVVPADVPDEPARQEAIAANLTRTFGLNETSVRSLLTQGQPKNPVDALLLLPNLSQEQAFRYYSHARDLPGVTLFKSAHREYADGLIFSHLLGYEGKIQREELNERPEYLMTDTIGKQGLEKTYETNLRGRHGAKRVEVDALGRIKRELGMLSPQPGNDLVLHIDAGLQKKIFDSLTAWLEKKRLTRAAAIALDPRSGAVRALVSLPSFDNNTFAQGISSEAYTTLARDPGEPLFNRAIGGEYPPGSTIKPIIAVGALTEGIIDEHTSIESRGGISVGEYFFGDWKAHGYTDIRQALAYSSDVFFYSVGGGYGGIRGLGMERMKHYEERFGLGTETGIDLPGEADGLLPDPQWKKERIGDRWYIGDDYHAAIGQGFVTATPLQIVNATAAIANGGTLYVPQIVSQIRDTNGKTASLPKKILRDGVAEEPVLRVVREGMRMTVTQGTAQSLADLPVAVAGKTGTAQYGDGKNTHGWFVSFSPYEQPELALIVLVEGQDEDGYNAVPVTKEILAWYYAAR